MQSRNRIPCLEPSWANRGLRATCTSDHRLQLVAQCLPRVGGEQLDIDRPRNCTGPGHQLPSLRREPDPFQPRAGRVGHAEPDAAELGPTTSLLSIILSIPEKSPTCCWVGSGIEWLSKPSAPIVSNWVGLKSGVRRRPLSSRRHAWAAMSMWCPGLASGP